MQRISLFIEVVKNVLIVSENEINGPNAFASRSESNLVSTIVLATKFKYLL